MSYPILKTAKVDWLRVRCEDLQPGQQFSGTFIGLDRRDGDWGPVVGEVAVMLIRETLTGDLISVPVLDRGVQRRLLGRMPEPGQPVTITCTGILDLDVTARGAALGFDIVLDQSEPVPEPPDEDPDDRVLLRSESDDRTLRDREGN